MNLPGVFCQTQNNCCQCDSVDITMFEPLLSGDFLEQKINVFGSQSYYDWDDANVILNTGEIALHKQILYNGYLDEMIWLMPGNNILVKLDKSRIFEVYLNTYHKLFRNIQPGNNHNFLKTINDSTIFAEVMLDTTITMYAYRQVKLVSSENIQYSSHSFIYDHIAPDPVYYIKLPDKPIMVTIHKINKKSLVHLFSSRENEVKKLLRENNLSVNSEADLIKALGLIGKAFY